MRENVRDEIDEIVDLDRYHVRISAFPVGSAATRRTVLPAPVLLTGLIGTLSEKSPRCPLPRPSLPNDCNHLQSGHAPHW
jgi:hypothetical protein